MPVVIYAGRKRLREIYPLDKKRYLSEYESGMRKSKAMLFGDYPKANASQILFSNEKSESIETYLLEDDSEWVARLAEEVAQQHPNCIVILEGPITSR